MRFWDEIRLRFAEIRITKLSVEETAPTRFVRTARLAHHGRQRVPDLWNSRDDQAHPWPGRAAGHRAAALNHVWPPMPS